MAALGKLTAGIAHEMNTPIGAIRSTMDVLSRSSAKLEQIVENSETLAEVKNSSGYQKSLKILKENSQVSQTASDRIAKIVSSLRNFTRLDESEFQRADLDEGIESTLTLIQHEIRDGIAVVKEFTGIPEINCYPSELNQVFMTLLTNAAQAIESEGTITIRTHADERNVYVSISDTGKGIPPEQLGALFEFSFTTIGSRVGVGLGLPNAYNIVRKHNGEIEVESEVGKGTEFTITLPRVEQPIED